MYTGGRNRQIGKKPGAVYRILEETGSYRLRLGRPIGGALNASEEAHGVHERGQARRARGCDDAALPQNPVNPHHVLQYVLYVTHDVYM